MKGVGRDWQYGNAIVHHFSPMSMILAFIRHSFNKKESNGCCGAKELIKLEAYTLTDHPVVVQLDLDVIVLKPMDPLFDSMLAESPSSNLSNAVPTMWPSKPIPERINAFFTRDCK